MQKKGESISGNVQKGPTGGYIDVTGNRETWKEIAKELNGEFRILLTSGNVVEMHRLTIPYHRKEIVFTLSDTRPLKVQISFRSLTDFEMVISRKEFMDKLLEKLGRKKITLGWDPFDKQYLIESNHPEWMGSVITPGIRQLLLRHKLYSVSFQHKAHDGTSELTGVIQRTPADREMILELIELFKALINNLEARKLSD